jgi:hypothetical protein
MSDSEMHQHKGGTLNRSKACAAGFSRLTPLGRAFRPGTAGARV